MRVVALSFSFTDFFLCKCSDLYLFLKENLKSTADLSIPVSRSLLKRFVVLA